MGELGLSISTTIGQIMEQFMHWFYKLVNYWGYIFVAGLAGIVIHGVWKVLNGEPTGYREIDESVMAEGWLSEDALADYYGWDDEKD